MTRPMTGQPATVEELTKANQRADKTMNDDVPEDIKNHPLTKESLKDDDTDEKTDDEKLAELREFKENNPDLYEDNGKGGQQIAVSDDEPEMEVTENGETETLTRDEWDERRDTRTRVWDRLARNGGVYVRVARWFNDADVNKVRTGRGFYAEKTDETDKAFKFTVSARGGNHNAGTETVWVPKKAVQVYELKK